MALCTLCMSSRHMFISDNNIVKQIRIEDGQLVRQIVIQSTPQSICISPDEQFLYVAYHSMNLALQGSPIHKYRVADGELMPMNGCKGNSICISQDGAILFISKDYMNEIHVVNTADGSNVRTIQLTRQNKSPYDKGNICLSPDGNILFVLDNFYNQIHIVHINGDYRILTIPYFRAYCISTDGEFLFASKSNNYIRVLSIEDGSLVRTIKCGDGGIIDSFCISPHKEIFTRGAGENRIRVFQL